MRVLERETERICKQAFASHAISPAFMNKYDSFSVSHAILKPSKVLYPRMPHPAAGDAVDRDQLSTRRVAAAQFTNLEASADHVSARTTLSQVNAPVPAPYDVSEGFV